MSYGKCGMPRGCPVYICKHNLVRSLYLTLPQSFAGLDPTISPELEQRANPPRSRTVSSGRSTGVAEELAAAQGASQVVLEGDVVNYDVIRPAAIVALGLMYLQTNEEAIASRLKVLQTDYDLDFIRPQHLQLMIIMRSLIMWDSIHPTEGWLLGQVPQSMRTIKSPCPSPGNEQAIAHGHCYGLAGSCVAVGLRFAGTCDSSAAQLLLGKLKYFMHLKHTAPEGGGPLTRDVLEACIGNVALALACVMSGSGDLETFKVLRALRLRIAPSTEPSALQPTLAQPPITSLTYGAHMAVSMAIGWLFLGAGELRFGQTPEAIASLFISAYPVWPTGTVDNRHHAQALRHLYCLAAIKRPSSPEAEQPDLVAQEVLESDSGMMSAWKQLEQREMLAQFGEGLLPNFV
jgi:anaphase-promoting complex subunit 1